MVIISISLLITNIVIYLLSIGKYDELIRPLNKKEYTLKRLLPIGFYILEGIGYKFNSQYDKFLLSKIIEIYGAREATFYLLVHWSVKILYLNLGLFVISLVGLKGSIDLTYILFSLLFLIGIIFLHDKELDKRIERRRLSIQLGFPDFLNKLALMVNAGLTVRRAWDKIAAESSKDTEFNREVKIVAGEIRSGKPELKAYEDFARRCRTAEIARFITVLLQNVKKGNTELVSILRVLSNESWEMRKNTTKKLGEEASTKMIIPLMLIFTAILIILATPAILAISQM